MRTNIRTIIARIVQFFSVLMPKSQGITVVTLHNILERDFQWFEEFVTYIDGTYGFINPDDFFNNYINIGKVPKILLTFDDGFLSNKILAESILEKYNTKAIFFVTEGFIGLNLTDSFSFSDRNFYPASKINKEDIGNHRSMSLDDVKWLSNHGHTIGAHTATHPVLSKINKQDKLIDEIVFSADRLESNVGVKINIFAFPFGMPKVVNTKIMKLIIKRFDFVFSNVRGNIDSSPSKYFLFRQNIVPGDPMWLVKLIIEGRLDWRYKKVQNIAHKKFTSDRY